jgi:hypothetical protein
VITSEKTNQISYKLHSGMPKACVCIVTNHIILIEDFYTPKWSSKVEHMTADIIESHKATICCYKQEMVVPGIS